MTITDYTAKELSAALSAGEITALEATDAYLKRIETHDAAIGAFLTVQADAAREQAAAIDQRRKNGEQLGPLAGVPVAVKDILCHQGSTTTCASRMLENFHPPYNATAIEKLLAADAVLIGRTNMDEFAMGGSTENSALGKTVNPWNKTCVPGGSSGGSAAATAARFAPLAIGTDTGGSIRQPAAFCGVVGMKPTYGRVSRYGLVAFASSLDQVGPFATTAEDAATVLEIVSGHDPLDSTCAKEPVPALSQSIDALLQAGGKPLAGIKLGLVAEHFGEGLNSEVEENVREGIRVLESLGATVKEVHLPHSKYSIATYYIIAPCEASSNLSRYDGVHYGYRADEKKMLAELKAEKDALVATGKTKEADDLDTPLVRMYRQSRAEGFGPEVQRRIMLGTYALSAGYYDAYYLKAMKVRRLIQNDYLAAFQDVDLVIGPPTPTPAFPLGDRTDDPLAMYLVDLYTASANLAGLPAISIPCGFSQAGLPIGLQLQGPHFAEEKLLQVAHVFQQETDWHKQQPSLDS